MRAYDLSCYIHTLSDCFGDMALLLTGILRLLNGWLVVGTDDHHLVMAGHRYWLDRLRF